MAATATAAAARGEIEERGEKDRERGRERVRKDQVGRYSKNGEEKWSENGAPGETNVRVCVSVVLSGKWGLAARGIRRRRGTRAKWWGLSNVAGGGDVAKGRGGRGWRAACWRGEERGGNPAPLRVIAGAS